MAGSGVSASLPVKSLSFWSRTPDKRYRRGHMTRLTNSRTLRVALAVILQLALLPGQDSLRCLLGAMGMGACCCADEEPGQPSGAPVDLHGGSGGADHCGLEAPAVPEVPSHPDGDDLPCGCDEEAGDPPPPLTAQGRDGSDQDREQMACANRGTALKMASTDVAPNPTVLRARTGPPLFVLCQIFLI